MTTGYRISRNEIFGMGINDYGQLAQNDVVHRSSAVQELTSTATWKTVVAGRYVGYGIKGDNSLWLWGNNNDGQLGIGDTTQRSSPIQTLSGGYNWKDVSGGSYHTLAIKTDGTLWGWGRNSSGQLGDGTRDQRIAPAQEALQSNTWRAVAAGHYHNAAIRTDGTLWTWGRNSDGQLGKNDVVHRSSPVQEVLGSTEWLTVSCGVYHVVAKRGTSTLWSWGMNTNGQLGLGDVVHRSSPVIIGANTTWKDASAGGYHTVAIKYDGTLWAWGRNTSGQVGDNTVTHRSSPVQEMTGTSTWKTIDAGGYHSAAIKTDNKLWSWGRNIRGAFGDGTVTQTSSPVQELLSKTNWKTLSLGENFTLGMTDTPLDFDDKYIRKSLFDDGNLYGWGNNTYGSLGDNSVTHRSSPVQTIAGGSNWKIVGSGWYHTVGIKTDGRLWAWGHNIDGQLGDGGITRKSSPVAIGTLQNWKTVSGGSYWTLATKTDGSAWAWGFNTHGQLGDSSQTHRSSPVQIGTALNWKVVSAGYYHSTGLRNDNGWYTWGRNHLGQLGHGDLTHRSAPTQVGSLLSWKDVSAGGYFSAALRNDGTIWICGENSRGQLGDNSSTNKSSPVQEITLSTNWKKIAAAGFHMMAIKNDGTLWNWGRNNNGQLGDNSITHRSSPVQTISGGTNWKLVAGSDYASTAIKSDGTLWSWGQGTLGRTAQGDQVHRSSPVQVGALSNWISLFWGGGGALAEQDDL
jgi:alpha-tubulin suppressor-like RCC1 family protein